MTVRDPDSPQWEACKECGGDHWTKDHPLIDPRRVGVEVVPDDAQWGDVRCATIRAEATGEVAVLLMVGELRILLTPTDAAQLGDALAVEAAFAAVTGAQA